MTKVWMFDPHSGGTKIPQGMQAQIRKRILDHAEKHYAGRYNRIEVRFRSQFCYIDAYVDMELPEDFDPTPLGETREQCLQRLRDTPTHLCRLRYFSVDNWSMAFYAYSSDKYEPCVFDTGEWTGTPEQALDTSAVYLND